MRRAMATFKNTGTVSQFQTRLIEGMRATVIRKNSPNVSSSNWKASVPTDFPRATRPVLPF